MIFLECVISLFLGWLIYNVGLNSEKEFYVNTDNPAGRLLYILQECKKISQTTTAREAWRKILNVNTNNDALLVSRLGKVMELPNQVINDIQNNFPNQKNSHRHWSTKVNTAFTQHDLNGLWSKFIQHIDEHTIDYLTMSVDLLDTKENITILSTEEMANIREKIDTILQEIIKMDLDENFKKYLTRYLRQILISIDEYNISGVIPIMESIEATLGHAFLDKQYRINLTNTEFGKKIIKVLSSVADIITISIGLPQIGGQLTQFLISE